MAVDIDTLQIQIEANSSDAASKIDALAAALTNLRASAKGGAGLTTTTRQLKALADAAKLINGTDLNTGKLKAFSEAMGALANIQRASGLNSTLNSLKKLPEITASLGKLDMSRFASQMEQVAAAMKPLADEMQKVSNGFSAFPIRIQKALEAQDKLADASKKTVKANRSLEKSNQSAGKSFGLLGGGVQGAVLKFGAYFLLFRQAADSISDWVVSANEYIENVNLFQVSMGEFYQEAYDYAMLVSDRLGIDPSEWMRNQGVFMSMANGFGLAREQAYALSEGLTELSYDLSSLYNEDVEQSALRLQSALAGEIEPIRRLGISISQATLQEYALAHGIDESVASMTEQEKALLRSLVLMEGAGRIGAIGDFAKTLESPANAMRILRQEITQLGRALGEVFIPILVQVIPVVQAFVRVITDAVTALALFLGFTMPEWDANDWGSGVTTGLGETEEAFGEAEKAAKEYNSAVLGIDELNIISPKQEAAGTGAGDELSNWAAGLEIPDIWNKDDISAIETRVDELEELIDRLMDRLAQPFQAFDFSAAKQSLDDFIRGIQEQIANWDFAEALWAVWDEGARAISAAAQFLTVTTLPLIEALDIPAIGYASLTALKSALDMLADAFESVTPGAQAFVELGLVPIAEWIGGRIYTTLMWLSEQFDKIGDWFVRMEPLFTELGTVMGEVAANLWEVLEPILTVAWDTILDILGRTVDTFGVLAENFIILTTVSGDLFNELYELFDAIGLVDFITQQAINRFDGFNMIIEGFQTKLQGTIDFITGVLTGDWEKAWGGIEQIVQGAFKSIEGVVAMFFGKDWVETISNWYYNDVQPWFTLERWMELGKQAIDGLFQGLSDMWGNISNWGNELLGKIQDKFRMHSPSRLFRDEVGYYLGAGIAEGLMDAQNEVVSAAETIAESVERVFQGIVYDPNTNYMELINEAKASGDLDAAARYESQRNAKIAGEGITEYAPTYEFTEALEPTNEFLTISNEKLEGLNTLSTEGNALSIAGNDLSTERNELMNTEMENAQSRYEEFTELFQNTYDDYMGKFDNALSTVVANFTSLKAVTNSGFSRTYSEIQSAASRIVASTDKIRIEVYNTYVMGDGLASGGFPAQGQMFIAREAGPELVGRIGNKSAVVNNDQIVSSVSQGVYDAVTAAMQTDQGTSNGRDINLNVYLDSKQIRASMKKADREAGASIMSGGVRNG